MTEAEKNSSTLQFGPKEMVPIISPWLIFAGGLYLAQMNWIPPLPKSLQGFLTTPQLTATVTGLLSFVGSIWQLWRNRRKHVQGKVQPGKVAIWVAELEGDGKTGAHRTNIIQTLKRELGVSVQILLAGIELRTEETGDAADEASAANREAQKYLGKYKGDLLIWGHVLPGPPVVIELRFTSPVPGNADKLCVNYNQGELRFNYDRKFRLEEGFGKELGAALAAVAAKQVLPALDQGNYVADVLIPIAQKLALLAKNLPASMAPDLRGLLFDSYAQAEAAIGNQRGDSGAFVRAIQAYRAVINEWTRESQPFLWAETQDGLGMALAQLGYLESGTVHLKEAVEALRAALEVFTRKRYPVYWAMTQCNLGSTLNILGYRESGTARLLEAVEAFRAALDVFTRERNPHQWATTQSNLSNTLNTLGNREGSKARLEESIAACGAALEVFTRDRVPLLWAETQCMLGAALRVLSTLESGTVRLEAADKAFRVALEEQPRDRVPLDWARTQHHLGYVQQLLGFHESGTERLVEAVAFYKAALEVLNLKCAPYQWGKVHFDLGLALHWIGYRESNNSRIEEALQAYLMALQVFKQGSNPFDWAWTQIHLGSVFQSLERLPEAVECYRRALSELTPETNPQGHSMAVERLSRVLEKLDQPIEEKP